MSKNKNKTNKSGKVVKELKTIKSLSTADLQASTNSPSAIWLAPTPKRK